MACSDSPTTPPPQPAPSEPTSSPTSTTVVATSIVLGAGSPVARVPVSWPPVVDHVVVRLTSVDNPRRQGVSVAVDVEGDAGNPVALGRVSPFPTDQPGTFHVAVGQAARRTLERGGVLLVGILPADEAVALDPGVRIVVDIALAG